MQTKDFDFDLPADRIAQRPVECRDASRLLVLHRENDALEHRSFKDLAGYLSLGDVLVLNNSRVIPARLRAVNAVTGGQFEILLLQQTEVNEWWTMMRPAKRARNGTRLVLCDHQGNRSSIEANVIGFNDEGHRLLEFRHTENILRDLEELGEIPLPPYISRAAGKSSAFDSERYQTVYAQLEGSVAAPTAGLHFTKSFLNSLERKGVRICFVTLHVGPGTFNPVKVENLAEHKMHTEYFSLPEETARAINETKKRGGKVFAVGTTSLRVLESVGDQVKNRGGRDLSATTGSTEIFIYPPRKFNFVDALLTNFHLPRSSLIMLAAAFASPGEITGRNLILHAYQEAINCGYRFFSYGDAMLIL